MAFTRKVYIDGKALRSAIHRNGESLNSMGEKIGCSKAVVKEAVRKGVVSLPIYNLIMHELSDERYGAFVVDKPMGYTERKANTTATNDDEIVISVKTLNALIGAVNTFAKTTNEIICEIKKNLQEGK